MSLIFVVLYSEGDFGISHGFDSVVAYGDTMRIFPKIFDDGLCSSERFLAVWNPLFNITGIEKFLKSIVIFEGLC